MIKKEGSFNFSRFRDFLEEMRSKLAEENGVTMIVVVGLVLLLTIMAVGLIAFATGNLPLTREARNYQKALGAAEAGLNKLLWDLTEHGIDSLETSFTVLPQSPEEGTATVRVPQASGFFVKAVSVGEYLGVRRAVEAVLFSTNIWEMNFAGGTQQSVQTGTSGITGSAEFIGPLFVRGTFPVSGTTDVYEGPLFVVGGSLIKESNGGNVGNETTPIAAYIDGSPPIKTKQGNEIPSSQWRSWRIYISPFNNWAPQIELPTLDETRLLQYRQRAQAESNETTLNDAFRTSFPNTQSGYYKVLDNDGANAPLGQGTFSITFDNNTPTFGVYDANGDGLITDSDKVLWEFAWYNPRFPVPGMTENRPTLFINDDPNYGEDGSTIFVDGPVTFNCSTDVYYRGRGTLVINGPVSINNRLIADEFPTTNALGIVCASTLTLNAQSPNDDNPEFQGAYFVLGDVNFNSNYQKFKGTIIGGRFIMNAKPKLEVDPELPNRLPPSLPGNPKEDGYLNAITSWREITPPW